MTVYYIDPHTLTNGTGTWASPWSLNSSTRTGLTTGDEIRIKGVALTSLLTATSYTATITNQYQMTITAGGGLGADFVAGNIVYVPDWGMFFRVYAVTTNTISLYTGTSFFPMPSSIFFGMAGVTIRKVDTTTYGPSASASTYNTVGATSLSNITVSDCWIDATTRVTDGSVKTLFNSSYTSSMTLYLGSSTAANPTGQSFDLSNTHVMCSQGTSTGYVSVLVYGSSSTYTLKQVFSWYYLTGGLTVGNGTTSIPTSTTVSFGNVSGVFYAGSYGKDITVNIETASSYYRDYIIGNVQTGFAFTNGLTINVGRVVHVTYSGVPGLLSAYPVYNATVNFNGVYDQTGTNNVTGIFSGYGNINFSFGPGFYIAYNKTLNTQTTLTNLLISQNYSSGQGQRLITPTIPVPPGMTVSGTAYSITQMLNAVVQRTFYNPLVTQIELPNLAAYNTAINGYSLGCNLLITFRDGTDPREVLSIAGNGYQIVIGLNSFPLLTRDASVKRTTGPSLRASLASRTAAYWGNRGKAIKTIKIPCTAGQTYTVTGYVRSSSASTVNGDIRMNIVLRDTVITYDDMTTACINAWEQFTMTFTAAETAEYGLAWEMYFVAGGQSIWLDDVTIA